jgi:hypothetical protein
MNAPALVRIPVGVVVERRKAANPWIDFTWRPVEVLDGRPEAAPWTQLSADAETATFYAGGTEIELHPSETAYYRDNLAGRPTLWVALRPTGVEPPYDLLAVSADPDASEAFTQAGDDLVEAVPMPETIRAIVAAFVAEHHVEQDFFKRKRDRANPEALARRGPLQEDE